MMAEECILQQDNKAWPNWRLFPVGAVVLCLLSLLVATGCRKAAQEDVVCYGKACFKVEVAADDVARTRGLQNRASLGAGEGMLFVFPESREHRFWMKETLIPLDMIWLDSSRQVVHVEKDVLPCKADPCLTYGPPVPALYVLELNAGISEKAGIQKGTRLTFQLDKYLAANLK